MNPTLPPVVEFSMPITLPPIGGMLRFNVFPPDYVTADGEPVLADGDYVTASE